MVQPVPDGFAHPMQSADFLQGSWPVDVKNAELVGKPGCLGMRWHYGPVWFEAYTTDSEPEIELTAHSRMVIWQPLSNRTRPSGWRRSWIQMNPRQHGFADIAQKPEYWKDWASHAERHRRRWLKNERYEIVEVLFTEFSESFHRSGKHPKLRGMFLERLKWRIAQNSTSIHLFAARDKQTKEIFAGLAVCDLPDVSCSVHLTAFIHPDFEKTSVGTGLIDHWFRHCQAVGIRFPFFGIVWAPGDPADWKGYSNFKRQFNLYLLLYPYPNIRFVGRKK